MEWNEDLTKGRPRVCSAQLAVPLWAHAAMVLRSRQGVPEEASAHPSIAQQFEVLLPHRLPPCDSPAILGVRFSTEGWGQS